MIEEPPLLTISRNTRRPSNDQIAAFQNVPTGFVVDAMYGAGALSSSIRPLGEGRDLNCVAAGPAFTADCGPGDILASLAALEYVTKGDILVSAFAGFQGCASGGDRLSGMLRNRGAAGFVTDGPMRDYEGLVSVGLPCWCTGLTPASPFTKGPGTVGLPISIGGQHVETGDMIIADRDGVVVVPYARINEVIGMLAKVKDLETALDKEIGEGLQLPASIGELLASDQVKYLD